MRITLLLPALVFAGAGLVSGAAPAQTQATHAIQPEHRHADTALQQAARFEHQATGVTGSERGRIFVNFPRWAEDSPVSVAEVMKDGSLRPSPDEQWNAWRNVRRDELDLSSHWVCVQSAGQRGALVVVDLASGKAHRVLDGHPSTQPEKGVVVSTDGKPLRYPDGHKVLFAADSIALSSDDQENAIKARNLAQGPAGGLQAVRQDPRLRWPDTFSQGPDGSLYVTASRIQDSAFFRRETPVALPTQLWRLRRLRD